MVPHGSGVGKKPAAKLPTNLRIGFVTRFRNCYVASWRWNVTQKLTGESCRFQRSNFRGDVSEWLCSGSDYGLSDDPPRAWGLLRRCWARNRRMDWPLREQLLRWPIGAARLGGTLRAKRWAWLKCSQTLPCYYATSRRSHSRFDGLAERVFRTQCSTPIAALWACHPGLWNTTALQ